MSRPQVLILDDREGLVAGSPGVARMRELADVRILKHSLDSVPDEALAQVQVIMAIRERTQLDAATLDRLPSLELILQTGGHAYHLDAAHATDRNIPVALGRRAFGPRAAVPELTFALAIAALRNIPAAHRSIVEGRWEPFMGRTLNGRTLGILGYGRHGQNVARIGAAFGMNVVAWKRDGTRSENEGGIRRLSLEDLLAESDIVSIHLKLSAESRGLLDAGKLGRMKEGSVLINTSRGAIIDEAALVNALQTGPLSAAGLDVFTEEPLPPDSPLRGLDNVVLTPHLGWTVEEVLVEFADIAADQLSEYFAGTLDRQELLDPAVTARDGVLGGLGKSQSV